jgi:hypothetical protein
MGGTLADWTQISVAFYVCHVAGDYLLQTDFQAKNKWGGLGRDPVARRALFSHLTTYLLAFVPALIWLGDEFGVWAAVGIAFAIWLPHLVTDDGRLLRAYMDRVKRCQDPTPELTASVDQAVHIVSLFAVALVAAS